MHILTCTCKHTHTCTYTGRCTDTFTQTVIYTCMHIYMNPSLCECTCTYACFVSLCIYLQKQECIPTYIHTYIRTYRHTCRHTHARTHTHTPPCRNCRNSLTRTFNRCHTSLLVLSHYLPRAHGESLAHVRLDATERGAAWGLKLRMCM